MQTQTKTMNTTLNANLGELPILKHFNQNEISARVDNFRKGEKGLYNVVKYGLIAVIAWGIWTYVLPTAFVKLGQTLALIATAGLLVFSYFVAPVFVKAVRKLVRGLHKLLIKYDPFGQFEIERQKMVQNFATFRVAKGGVAQLEQDMQIEAKKAEDDATKGQTKIITLQGKAEKIKSQMDAILQAKGAIEGKSDDEYVNLAADLQKTVAEATRVINQTKQSQDFVQKYGSRAVIMKKMRQNLTMVEAAMQIKLSDFDATIEMLKKDYEFGQKANAATSAAKSALGFSKGWEFDYALDVVQTTISNDIAMTAGNLKDIETLTSNYTLDSDELFANLNQIADKIKLGNDIVPSAKAYANPEYKLTSDDKLKSGGFQELF